MSETTNTPDQIETTTPTSTTTHHPTKPTSGRRKLLVAGGAVVTALLLAGGGIAVGAALADEGDDDSDAVSASTVSEQDDDDSHDADDDTASADLGTTSADELIEIVEAASSEADGTAVSIDAEPDGSWHVEFRAGSGDETEVRVAPDGTATVIATEAADADAAEPQGGLDAQTLKALVAAALGEVDGKVVDVEVDDDTTGPYDISVVTGDGRTVDLALDADMKVIATDTDD